MNCKLFHEKFISNFSLTQQQLDENEDISISFKKLINMTKYWFSKMKEAMDNKTLILCIYNTDKEAILDTQQVLLEIQNHLPVDNINNVFYLKSPKFIGITFNSEYAKKYIMENMRSIQENYVVYLEWGAAALVHEMRLLWLPGIIKVSEITTELQKYIDIISITQEQMSFQGKINIPTNKYFIQFKIKNNINIKLIPYFIVIKGFQGLIVIRERLPICLSCNEIGHFASQCSKPYCKFCRINISLSHECVKDIDKDSSISYANVLKLKSSITAITEKQDALRINTEQISNLKTLFNTNQLVTKTIVQNPEQTKLTSKDVKDKEENKQKEITITTLKENKVHILTNLKENNNENKNIEIIQEQPTTTQSMTNAEQDLEITKIKNKRKIKVNKESNMQIIQDQPTNTQSWADDEQDMDVTSLTYKRKIQNNEEETTRKIGIYKQEKLKSYSIKQTNNKEEKNNIFTNANDETIFSYSSESDK